MKPSEGQGAKSEGDALPPSEALFLLPKTAKNLAMAASKPCPNASIDQNRETGPG